MREKCNMFDGIEHLTLFSAFSLNLCFEQAGLSPLFHSSVITDSFALNNYLSYESDPYLPVNQLSDKLCSSVIDFASIEKKSLGYKIQACFQNNV